MKKLFIIPCVVTMIIVISTFSWGQEVMEGIVAVVGDEIILRSELIQATQAFAMQMGLDIRTQTEELEQLKKNVLTNLINEKVLLAKAIDDTITVEDQQVEAALEERIQGLIQQLGSKERVESYFGSPIKKIKRDYREEIRKQLVVNAVRQEKFRDIKISRGEIEKFYETMKDSLPEKKPMVKLRHILLDVRPGDAAKRRALERIREIQELLRQGEDFEEVARRYSEDPGTASQGGNLGFVEKGTLFRSFEETGFQLNPGEVSDVVETPVGLHLIQMVEKRGDKANMRHILIRIDVTSTDEYDVQEQLLQIRERALAGEDFAELATEFSSDVTTKENGGDLGWLPLEDLQIEAFKTALDTVQIGEITMPFQTQFGYHIVKLEDRSEARKISLENDFEQIRAWAMNIKSQKILNEWIEELKKNLYIKVNENLM